jgi:hypothetical protein
VRRIVREGRELPWTKEGKGAVVARQVVEALDRGAIHELVVDLD